MLASVLLWLTLSSTEAFIVYNCEDRHVNISVISLKDVDLCTDGASDYISNPTTVQIIQRNEVKLQQVQTCLVEVTRTIMHCGMHSHVSAVSGGIAQFLQPLGAEGCRNLHLYRSTKLYNRDVANIIIMNGTTSISMTIAGKVSDDGTCQGTPYNEGHEWTNVIVTASIRIYARDYWATVKMERNELSLSGGLICPYLTGYCIDTTYGESVWNHDPEVSCEQGLSLLFEGSAELVEDKKNNKYLVVEQEEKVFAMALKTTIHI